MMSLETLSTDSRYSPTACSSLPLTLATPALSVCSPSSSSSLTNRGDGQSSDHEAPVEHSPRQPASPGPHPDPPLQAVILRACSQGSGH